MARGPHLRILLVEDNPDHAAMILRQVRRSTGDQLQAEHAATLALGVEALGRQDRDAVLLDLQLPDSQGLATLDRMVDEAAGVPVIVLTSLGDEDLATRALQQGAQDYLVKDQITAELLSRTVRYAMERKRIEERLKLSLAALAEHAAELEQLNRKLQQQNIDLDNFNHMISHDLREPIRHLMLFGERLRGDAGGSLPEKACRDLHQVQAAAERMESSIAGLQVLSMASRRDLRRERVKLHSCVDSAVNELAPAIAARGAEISRDPLPEVAGDAALLTLLFRNLISNAIRYCAVKPSLRITAEQGTDQQPQWVFGVLDNGIGVDPRYADRIFVPFQRLHAREEYGGGSGLGLAICQKIVERHGGRIWVDAGPGQGSHFRFTLCPDAVANQPAANAEPSAARV